MCSRFFIGLGLRNAQHSEVSAIKSMCRTKWLGLGLSHVFHDDIKIIVQSFSVAKGMHHFRYRGDRNLFSRGLFGESVFGRPVTVSAWTGRALTTRTSASPSPPANEKDGSKTRLHPHYMESIAKSSVVVKVKDLEEHWRIKGYSTFRWGLGILVLVGFGIYMFREPIKENLSDEVADVATRSLGGYRNSAAICILVNRRELPSTTRAAFVTITTLTR